MTKDIPTILIAICLLAAITAVAVIVVLDGKEQLGGTGLGGLIAVLAGALVWRVQHIKNGNGGGK